ncbi:hypothetical protein QUF80_04895 [Desulfococcaceae bacterium HSG8]|nr:hypothetical protein [Desulfococcaceae bacterium HSG8]
MSDKKELINEVKSLTGISDLRELDKESTEKILKLVGEQRLKEAHINAVIEVAPQFVRLQTEILQTISAAIEGLEKSQRTALETIQTTLKGLTNILQTLAENMETDEGRMKIAECTVKAGEQFIEVSKTLASMNKENNGVWKWVVGGLAAGLTLLVGGVVAKGLSKKEKQNEK